jgi:hypothetical protein
MASSIGRPQTQFAENSLPIRMDVARALFLTIAFRISWRLIGLHKTVDKSKRTANVRMRASPTAWVGGPDELRSHLIAIIARPALRSKSSKRCETAKDGGSNGQS